MDVSNYRIGYILQNKNNKYRPLIGKPIPDDDDSFMAVVANGSSFENLKEAQMFLQKNKQGIDKISLEPVKTHPMGTWLSQLKITL